jgi:DNA-binding GntR family transcriptional regulator
MATVDSCCTAQIGETAGVVWHTLDENGPLSLAKLAKQVDAPRDVVMQAIGWLAREGKIDIEETGRTRVVSLR